MHTATRTTPTRPFPTPPPPVEILTATTRDTTALAAVLTLAFAADPAARWIYPQTGDYAQYFPEFVRHFGGGALDHGTGYHTAGFTGCALWMPPGAEPNEAALVALIEHSVPRRRHDEVFAVFEAMGEVHPTEPHWYLPLIGVDAAFQGLGIGSALLEPVLAACDCDGLPAYLEATTARSVALYERHGFRGLEPLQVGSCPPLMPMWREPR